MNLINKEEFYEIVGAAMEVHNQLGCGFLEAVYQEALKIEFNLREIEFEKEKCLPINYKGNILNKYYMADFLCFEDIIVEIKAKSNIENIDIAQTINYLKVTGCRLGIIINFGTSKLQYKRIVC